MNGDFPSRTSQTTLSRQAAAEGHFNIQPSTDWLQHAMGYFFRNFVHTPSPDGLGYLQFLPDLLSSQPNNLCLRDSLNAVAMTSFANVSSTRSFHFRADELYSIALRSLSVALQSSSGEDDAALLAAMFLIQKREALSGNVNAMKPHETGLIQLLRAKAPRKPQSEPEAGLLWTIHARLQVRSMDGGKSCADGLDALDLSNGPARPLQSGVKHMFGNVSKFCREMKLLTRLNADGLYSSSSIIELSRALDMAFETERELAAWPSTLLPEQLPREVELAGPDGVCPELKFINRVYAFPELQDACRWAVYWTSRIQLLVAIGEGLDLESRTAMRYESPLSREAINRGMQSAADSICSAIPFMIGEVDSEGCPLIGQRGQALGAYFATRFIHIVNEVPFLSQQQRLWTMDCLLKLGQVWGIGAALQSRTQMIQRFHLVPII
ncbi:unnamed protein product [Clonostachys rosea]|uniref:Transcription factor domain-containing protein n=1 Tax=Bionectria ochroleuca TaxID=29856 RepID=A0ABY6V1U3_BIOOC|nr:unnamed protein product [Clonostachys rosea]